MKIQHKPAYSQFVNRETPLLDTRIIKYNKVYTYEVVIFFMPTFPKPDFSTFSLCIFSAV